MNTCRRTPTFRWMTHYWPGAGDINHQPGARAACGVHASPTFATPHLDDVTCRACRRSRAFKAMRTLAPALVLDRAGLQRLGMLEKGAPPPVLPREPYRNPRLARSGPVGELAGAWRELSVAHDVPPVARAAFASCASELEDRLSTLRRGGW